MKLIRTCVFLAGISVAGSSFAQAYSVSSYKVDGLSANLTGLNNLGQVTGYFTQANFAISGFVSAPNAGTLSYLTFPAGGRLVGNAMPYAINDNGMVVGAAKSEYTIQYTLNGVPVSGTGTTTWAFVAGPDLIVKSVGPDAGVLSQSDPTFKFATDINTRGDILVQSGTNGGFTRNNYLAKPAAGGAYTTRSVPTSSYTGGVSRINDSGQIVIDSSIQESNASVVAPDLASAQSARTLMGVPYVNVSSINASGQTVGVFQSTPSSSGMSQAFLAEPGFTNWRPLAGLTATSATSALDINDSGQVVGWSKNADGINRAFVTGPQGLGMTDLNSLVTLSSGEYLNTAFRINEAGQILAKSNLGISYFLNPSAVPEPGTLGLMAMGLMAVTFIRRKAVNS